MEFPLLEACLPAYSFVDIDTIMPVYTAVFDTFQPLSCDVLASIIHKLNRTTCGLDPFPTKLLMSHLSSIINIILRIVNLCFSSGDFPASCKSAIISPLIKKTSLDSEILKNYRPVANLSFISKIIEKAIATQIHSHLINNDIVDNFQSAYKTGHSCETALLRVYNDIVTTIGRGNGAMLVLLDLSAAFDTIDHDNLFCILEKYVGICGNALKLIKSYFSNRTQRVQIDNVLSDFANIICGVPQGSVLGPLKFCLYLLPLSAILRYHNIGYHVYADDTQLYVSFKCKQPLEAISKLNSCLADIRRWMITNNYSKTEFIVFRSPQLKCDLSGLSVNVGESMITQSSKVRDLGVIFDQFLNFDDHITAICRSTHFHIRNIGKIRNLLSYDACSTIIHALISCRLDYCNSILYNVPKSKTDRLLRIQNQCARILTKSPRREHITPVLMKLHWLKIQDRIIYKMLMLTYKSYYNMAPPYLCELINKKESHVNTRLGTDHHQLIIPPISKDCSNTFLERSFIYAAPCEWNKLSKHIRTSNFDCFRKSVKTMLFTQQYGC